MSFEGTGQKFTGSDASMVKATFSTEIPGDASTPLPVGTYLITGVAAVSTFPAAALGGTDPAVGDVLVIEGSQSVTPAIGDDVVTLIVTDLCDITSWALDFSKEEINVTVLCDDVNKYSAGKADAAGTLSGIFTAGISDATDGFLRQFIRIAKQDGDVSFDSFAQQDAILLGFFYVNKDRDKADTMAIVTPFQLFGNKLGAAIGEAQAFESPWRIANLSYTDTVNGEVPIEPTFYRWGDGS